MCSRTVLPLCRMSELNHQVFGRRNQYPMARLSRVSKRYGGNRTLPPAVSRLNFSFYQGQVTAILGHNGTHSPVLLPGSHASNCFVRQGPGSRHYCVF